MSIGVEAILPYSGYSRCYDCGERAVWRIKYDDWKTTPGYAGDEFLCDACRMEGYPEHTPEKAVPLQTSLLTAVQARAEEREMCAVICDEIAEQYEKNEEYFLDAVARAKTNAAKRCAAEIRANS